MSLGSRPALCEAAVDVKSFVPSILTGPEHTSTGQRIPFTSLSALPLGDCYDARRRIANAVITVEEFLAALDSSGVGRVDVQTGDTVRGSDHGEIGTVERVVEATEETEGYLLVPRGVIFKTDTYVPLDAVVKRAGTDVFVNIPKLFVGEMPWGEPPSRAGRQAKLGARSTEVDKLYGSRSPSTRERPNEGGG